MVNNQAKQNDESLKSKAVYGTMWSAIQKFGVSMISFLSNIVLARLLTPDDYGCIGMLSIFIMISNSLILGGFVSALIQKKDARNIDYSTVFYWNLIVSALLYIILYLAAPSIASFYRIEMLVSILRVQGLILLLNGLSAVQTTLLRKSLRFKILAKINIVASTVSVFVAVFFAYNGFGVWSLVLQQISLSLLNTALLWFYGDWKPNLIFSLESFRSLFSYGSFLLLSEIINTFCDNIQGLIIGRQFTPSIMGYYSQAKKLEEIPTTSITQIVHQVTFPIYAKVQDDRVRLKSIAKRTLSMMNYINFPLMLLLFVVAKPLILLLYSEKWLESVPYFQILCLAGLANCLQSVNYQIVAAVGRSKELFYWNFVKRGVGITFMLIGLIFGVKGLLVGMVLSMYFTYIVNCVLAKKTTNYGLIEQVKDFFPTLIIASISSVLSSFVYFYIESELTQLVCIPIIYVTVYIVMSYVLEIPELKELLNIVRLKKRKEL